MRRFLMPSDWEPAPTCAVLEDRAHYLSRVLRLGCGDSFPAMDALGRHYECAILECDPGKVLLSVTKTGTGYSGTRRQSQHDDTLPATLSFATPFSAVSSSKAPRIILVQALSKAGKMDLIVRQATEAGVSLVLPVLSRHCVSRPETGNDRILKKQRWERVVREALQQSGSAFPTRIHDIVELHELPATLDSVVSGDSLRLLLHEAPLDSASLHGYLGASSGTIVLCIGPEGGFSPEETSFLLEGGFRIMHFRTPILRTETAALYAVAAVQTIISERSAWKPT